VRHSALLTRSLVTENLIGEDFERRLSARMVFLPDDVAHRALDIASSLASSLLPPALRPSGSAVSWETLAAAAAEPSPDQAWGFSRAAYGALKRACSGLAGNILISESRLFSAYRSAVAADGAADRIGFLAALVVALQKSKAVIDIDVGRTLDPVDRAAHLRQAVFALGLFMAASIADPDNDAEGQFDAALDLAHAVGDELGPAVMADDKRVATLLDRFKDHL